MLHIGPIVKQLRAEVHTIDDTTLSLTAPTTDPSQGGTPQALNGGFRSDVASTRTRGYGIGYGAHGGIGLLIIILILLFLHR